MPPEYALGDKDNYVRSIKNSMAMFSPDGRFGGEGPEVALKVLTQIRRRCAEGVDQPLGDLHRSLRRQGPAALA
jgi:hypothetical protein